MSIEANTKSQGRALRGPNLALIALIIVCLGIILTALLLSPRVVPAAHRFNDFYDYYIGSRLFWDGKYPYGVTPDFVRLVGEYGIHFIWGTGYDYPPFLTLVFRPLLFLAPETAAWVWTGAGFIALGILVYLVARQVRGRWRKLIVAFYMLSYTPVLYSIGSGQVNIVVLCLMAAYLLGRKEWLRVVGLTMASLIKVFPVLFVGKEILQRRFRFAVLCLALMAGILLIPAILRGPGLVVTYFIRVVPQLNHAFNPDMSNQSLNGMFSRLFADPWMAYLAVPGQILTGAGLVVTLVILAVLCILTLHRDYDEPVLTLIWLAGLTLIAGRNMFWNFAPCVFIGVFLIEHWEMLAGWQRWLFIASVLVSNLLWHVVYGLGFATVPADLPIPRALFVLIFSLGTVSLVLEAAALFGLPAAEGKQFHADHWAC